MKKLISSVALAVIFLCNYTSAQQLWSDPLTWGGVKPAAGQHIIIPSGTHIILDENPPALGSLTINGRLEFERKNIELSAGYIIVHGEFHVGTVALPFIHKAVITLTADNMNENIMGMGTRGILVMGGILELHGTSPGHVSTKLNAHAAAGSTALSLLDAVNWNVNDQVIIAPTDYYESASGMSVTQRTTISSINGTQLNIQNGLNAFRWGLLQYATSNGMSLSMDNLVNPPVPDSASRLTPTVLDERAVVGNLTRNILVQSANDVLWNNHGFGVHVMIMGAGATAHVDGVEFSSGIL